MQVIIGLGNPGKNYENTKHNVGFIAIDLIAETLGVKVNKLKHKALVGEGRIGSEKVLLVKPQTFMNLSGESVREIVQYYDLDLENITIIYDDIDIPLGTLRLRKMGSAGTHNGMRNIIYHLKDEGFNRIRVGIGKDRGEMDLRDYVVSGFDKKDVPAMENLLLMARDSAIDIVENGIDHAMCKYNTSNSEKQDR
jgi:PTH1 family peptidyl-tRNA hydrolase